MTKNNNDKYIMMYADEYDVEAWRDYCIALNVPYDSEVLKVIVKSVEIVE